MKQALEKGPAQIKSFLDNYRALVITVGLLLSSLCIHAQFYDSTKLLQDVNAYGYRWKNGKFRGPLILGNDTSKLAAKDSGAIAFKHNKFWGNNGYGWSLLDGKNVYNNDGIQTGNRVWNANSKKLHIDSLNTFILFSYATEQNAGEGTKIKNTLSFSDDANDAIRLSSQYLDNTNSDALLYTAEFYSTGYESGLSATDHSGPSSSLIVDPYSITANTDSLVLTGKLNINTGANKSIGTATLSAGTVTVNTNKVTSNSIILLTPQQTGMLNGRVRVSAKVNATSFTITSTDGGDNAQIGYLIIN